MSSLHAACWKATWNGVLGHWPWEGNLEWGAGLLAEPLAVTCQHVNLGRSAGPPKHAAAHIELLNAMSPTCTLALQMQTKPGFESVQTASGTHSQYITVHAKDICPYHCQLYPHTPALGTHHKSIMAKHMTASLTDTLLPGQHSPAAWTLVLQDSCCKECWPAALHASASG